MLPSRSRHVSPSNMKQIDLPETVLVARGVSWGIDKFASELILARPAFRANLHNVQIGMSIRKKIEEAARAGKKTLLLTDAELETFTREAMFPNESVAADLQPVVEMYLYALMTARPVESDPEKAL